MNQRGGISRALDQTRPAIEQDARRHLGSTSSSSTHETPPLSFFRFARRRAKKWCECASSCFGGPEASLERGAAMIAEYSAYGRAVEMGMVTAMGKMLITHVNAKFFSA
ncbi:hypothetical protein MRX96_041869 [Rhipicephalus microplus]